MSKIDISSLLNDLAAKRPAFHSEADFQHELALCLREHLPDFNIRLEFPIAGPANGAIDILVRDADKPYYAFELKYLCQRFEAVLNGDTFALKPQGAQDIRRYDVLKDVVRMEQFSKSHPGVLASVIVLSNDPAYWTGPRSDKTCDAAFALREGRQARGNLDWLEKTRAGTKQGREKPIKLVGSYEMRWEDYSRIDGRFGRFRFLHIDVGDMAAGEKAALPHCC